MEDRFPTTFKVCSECGRKFSILSTSEYTYKYYGEYQCSYTCYDHILIRLKDSKDTNDYNNSIRRCENMMKSQGKTILHPIEYLDN